MIHEKIFGAMASSFGAMLFIQAPCLNQSTHNTMNLGTKHGNGTTTEEPLDHAKCIVALIYIPQGHCVIKILPRSTTLVSAKNWMKSRWHCTMSQMWPSMWPSMWLGTLRLLPW
jgi:hypothetical protein